jgi:hypothetical protein
MVFGFLKKIPDGISEGHRAGRIVLLIQQVIGRKFSSSETTQFKLFYDAGEYSEKWSDSNIVMDYFCFLVITTNMPDEQKGGLGGLILTAIINGTLSIESAALKEYYIKAGFEDLANAVPNETD